jgi:hypothetical protein
MSHISDILSELGVSTIDEKIAQRNALKEQIIKSIKFDLNDPFSYPHVKSVPNLTSTSKNKILRGLQEELKSCNSDKSREAIILLKLRYLEHLELNNLEEGEEVEEDLSKKSLDIEDDTKPVEKDVVYKC